MSEADPLQEKKDQLKTEILAGKYIVFPEIILSYIGRQIRRLFKISKTLPLWISALILLISLGILAIPTLLDSPITYFAGLILSLISIGCYVSNIMVFSFV